MFERTFDKSTPLPSPQAEAFAWHTRPGAFERLSPPWDDTRVLAYEGIRDGQRVVLRVKAPWPRRWVAEHQGYIHGLQFQDRQVQGPFPAWLHTHRVEPDPTGRTDACVMHDHIDFKLPMGPLGVIAHALFMKKQLQRMFDHRHATLAADLADHQRYRGDRPLTVAITGASGFIGSNLSALLTTAGHTVRPVHRRDGLTFDLAPVRGSDILVHLAGEPIAQRWSADAKDRIKHSRVDRTRLLCEALQRLPDGVRPSVLLSGSAVGFYGDRGDALLTEDSSPGQGFLAEVCQHWEGQTQPAAEAGIRVVHLRTGVVLSPRGGALKAMLTPFKLGLAGRLGSGRQYMPWIALDDHLRAMLHAMFDERLHGPVNLVAPKAVTNRVFTKTLGRVLRRPTLLPAPRVALRLALGELADEAVLASQRVEPMRLIEHGFAFRHGDLEAALRAMLGRF